MIVSWILLAASGGYVIRLQTPSLMPRKRQSAGLHLSYRLLRSVTNIQDALPAEVVEEENDVCFKRRLDERFESLFVTASFWGGLPQSQDEETCARCSLMSTNMEKNEPDTLWLLWAKHCDDEELSRITLPLLLRFCTYWKNSVIKAHQNKTITLVSSIIIGLYVKRVHLKWNETWFLVIRFVSTGAFHEVPSFVPAHPVKRMARRWRGLEWRLSSLERQ